MVQGPHWWRLHRVIISSRFYRLAGAVGFAYVVYRVTSRFQSSGKGLNVVFLTSDSEWGYFPFSARSYVSLHMQAGSAGMENGCHLVSMTQQMIPDTYLNVAVFYVTTTSWPKKIKKIPGNDGLLNWFLLHYSQVNWCILIFYKYIFVADWGEHRQSKPVGSNEPHQVMHRRGKNAFSNILSSMTCIVVYY